MRCFVLLLLCFVAFNIQAKPKHHQISINGFTFEPKVILLNKGDSVTWTNNDVVMHNISLSKGEVRLSEDLAFGEQFSMLVTESIDYICGLHPPMKGRILIESER